jgi:hypothetical protein
MGAAAFGAVVEVGYDNVTEMSSATGPSCFAGRGPASPRGIARSIKSSRCLAFVRRSARSSFQRQALLPSYATRRLRSYGWPVPPDDP